VVQPRVLAGKHGDLADLQLLDARRSDVEDLMRAHLAKRVGMDAKVEIDWRDDSATPAGLAAFMVSGNVLPARDARYAALRAAASEAVMMACD
jgi:hypothetical protein